MHVPFAPPCAGGTRDVYADFNELTLQVGSRHPTGQATPGVEAGSASTPQA